MLLNNNADEKENNKCETYLSTVNHYEEFFSYFGLLALRKGINDAFKFHSIVIVTVHTCNDIGNMVCFYLILSSALDHCQSWPGDR